MLNSAIDDQKRQLRQVAQQRRGALTDRRQRSEQIIARLEQLPEYASAGFVLFYISVRNEVETHRAIASAIAARRAIAVPYCENGELRLVRLVDLSELETGAYNIPEPSLTLRTDASRRVEPAQIDLVVVPGVTFDARGNRLGHGAGYYDKLLAQMRSDTVLAALAFDCQMVESVPSESHDMPMDYVLTESAVHVGRRRAAAEPFPPG